MNKQDLQRAFDDLRDNNDTGAKAYRVAEFLAPMVGIVAPVNDVDLAFFEGQDFMDTVLGNKYFATAVTDTTTTWKLVSVI